jgi:hypothetical protein
MKLAQAPSRGHIGLRRSLGRRLGFGLGVVAAIAIVAAPIAQAGKPARAALFIPNVIDLPAGAACAFDIRIDVLVNQEFATTFERSGTDVLTHTTGRLVVSVTNVATGASETFNISGPGLNVTHADGTVTIHYFGRGMPFADNGMWVTTGPSLQEVAADGSIISTTFSSNRSRDVCAEIG